MKTKPKPRVSIGIADVTFLIFFPGEKRVEGYPFKDKRYYGPKAKYEDPEEHLFQVLRDKKGFKGVEHLEIHGVIPVEFDVETVEDVVRAEKDLRQALKDVKWDIEIE